MPDTGALRSALLSWYRRHRRDLPWRRTGDPYHIWVSEIMLQQTRVDAVIPYYERFLQRFPSISALADAPEDDVLARWAGLGYYRRARMLHAAASTIVRDHGGRFPSEPDAVRALPGIGRYTAGAILSIGFGQCEPLVDGNVERVLSRVYRLRGDPKSTAVQKQLWKRAGELVQGESPGDLNQSLMELGATICLPKNQARCDDCPIRKECMAYEQDLVEQLPTARKKVPPRIEHWITLRAVRRGRHLLRPRHGEALMRDLWELPTIVIGPKKPRGLPTELFREHWSLELRSPRLEQTLVRGISGRKVTFHILEADVNGLVPASFRWLTNRQAAERALTTSTRLLLEQRQTEGRSKA